MSETQFAMISDWMVNGNISDFVKAHPDTNRLELVGFHSRPRSLCFNFANNRVTCLVGRRH